MAPEPGRPDHDLAGLPDRHEYAHSTATHSQPGEYRHEPAAAANVIGEVHRNVPVRRNVQYGRSVGARRSRAALDKPDDGKRSNGGGLTCEIHRAVVKQVSAGYQKGRTNRILKAGAAPAVYRDDRRLPKSPHEQHQAGERDAVNQQCARGQSVVACGERQHEHADDHREGAAARGCAMGGA